MRTVTGGLLMSKGLVFPFLSCPAPLLIGPSLRINKEVINSPKYPRLQKPWKDKGSSKEIAHI